MKNDIMKNLARRDFIKIITGLIIGLSSGNLNAAWKLFKGKDKNILKAPKAKRNPGETHPKLAVITGKDHAAITRRAIEAIGGIKKFVKKGDIVVVKPNMAWDRNPQQAANTNPVVIREIVKLCYVAGAKKVKVFDRSCSNSERSYRNSGIADSAKEAGAEVFHVDDWNYVDAEFDYESPLESWPIYRDALTADCFINVPVLKHHSLVKLTLSMKNLMGVMGGNRGKVHADIATKIAHLADFVSPNLTLIDATRVLMKHGPSGGWIEDVKIFDTVIASLDYVLADSEATRLVGQNPLDIGYIKKAADMGLGKTAADMGQLIKETI